jgi:hypothetical protein
MKPSPKEIPHKKPAKYKWIWKAQSQHISCRFTHNRVNRWTLLISESKANYKMQHDSRARPSRRFFSCTPDRHTHTYKHTRTHAQHVTVEESALSVRHWIATYRTRQIVDSPKLQANAMYFQLLNNCEKTDCCREMGIQGVLFNPCPVDILASHKARVRLYFWISS